MGMTRTRECSIGCVKYLLGRVHSGCLCTVGSIIYLGIIKLVCIKFSINLMYLTIFYNLDFV